MKLRHLRGLIFLWLVICSVNLGAAEPLHPAHLPADWWSYFEPKEPVSEAEFAQRADKFVANLQSLVKQFDAAQIAAVQGQVGQIKTNLSHILEAKKLPPAAPKTAVVIQAEYTLEEALQQHALWRALKQEVDAEQEEVNWQNVLIAEQRKLQSRRRNQYLELADTESTRAQRGIELIANRTKIELLRFRLERRKDVLRIKDERLARLAAELEVIPDRLTASDAQLKKWQSEYQQTLQDIQAMQQRREAAGVGLSAGTDVAANALQVQYTALEQVSLDIKIAVLELKANRAELAQALILLVSGSAQQQTAQVRKLLVDQANLLDRMLQQGQRWQRVPQRIRATYAIDHTEAQQDSEFQKKLNGLLIQTDQALQQLFQTIEVSTFIAKILKKKQHETEGWWQRSVKDIEQVFVQSWSKTMNLLSATLIELNETPVTTLGLLRVFLIITIALWISKGIRRAIQRIGERRGGINQSSLYTFGRLIHYVVLTIGIIIGLSSIGIDFTKFALFASALGVGIGFGLQTLISNFVAGLIILFEKSLKVGDFVELESGVTGEVKEINMRSTLITTNDNIDILVPNSEFVGGRVINWTLREAFRRIHVPFGVAYGTDKDKVKTAVLEAADSVPWTLKNKKGRQPQVWLVEFGDSSLNFELVVWLTSDAVKRPGAVHAAYLWAIETQLRAYEIEIPYPQRDLHLRSVFGMRDEQARSLLPNNELAMPDQSNAP